jgi:hypothetical protein
MEYKCDICIKQYKSYQSLWNHNKKFHEKIEKPSGYTCKFCNKFFDNRFKKCYHQKNCKNNTLLNNPTEQPIVDNHKTKIDNTITNGNNNTINTGTINHITINNYNNDNLEYISEQFKEKLFNNLLKSSEHVIPLPKLIENIKFNPNHKENNNVKITSDRSKIGLYYDDNRWKAINKNELLDDLCDYSLKIFKDYFEEYKEELSEDIISKFKSFSHIAKLKSQLRKEIKDKIENIAYIFTKNNDNDLDV